MSTKCSTTPWAGQVAVARAGRRLREEAGAVVPVRPGGCCRIRAQRVLPLFAAQRRAGALAKTRSTSHDDLHLLAGVVAEAVHQLQVGLHLVDVIDDDLEILALVDVSVIGVLVGTCAVSARPLV
jgi:hypothetical protein